MSLPCIKLLMHAFNHIGGNLQPVVVNLMMSALETYHLFMTNKLWLLKRDCFLVSKLLYSTYVYVTVVLLVSYLTWYR